MDWDGTGRKYRPWCRARRATSSCLPCLVGKASALIGSDVPMAHEHNLFLGVGAFSLFALGSIVIWFAAAPPDIARLSKAAFLALACLFLCLTMFGNFSLYYYISALPGLNAI